MKKISNIQELKSAIQQLEEQQMEEWSLLKNEYVETCIKLKSVNEIQNFDEGSDFKRELIDTGLSIAAGYFSRKIVPGFLSGPLKRLVKTFIQMGVTNFVSKHADEMKSVGQHVVHHILGKKTLPSLGSEETLNPANNYHGQDDAVIY